MQVKPPRAKTICRAMRWRLGSWRRARKGRGRVATRMSVRMLTPALENLGARVRCWWWWWFGRRLGFWREEGRWFCLPDGPLAEAFAVFDRSVPEVLDGFAEKDGAEDGPAGPGEDESHEAEAQDAEEAVRENSQVLEEDGEFGEEESEVVDDD